MLVAWAVWYSTAARDMQCRAVLHACSNDDACIACCEYTLTGILHKRTRASLVVCRTDAALPCCCNPSSHCFPHCRAGTASQMIYHLGEWLLPLLAFWLQDWRLLNLAIAAICCITGLLLLPFPESPRWLLLKGRQQEARQALSWLAAVNGRQLPEGLDITHTVELTAAADGAAECEGQGEGAADGMSDADCCGKGSGDTSSSRSLQQQGAAAADLSAEQACKVGLSAAPLAAGATSNDIDSDGNLLDSDCTALLSGHDNAAAHAKQAVQDKHEQQHQQQQGQKQQPDTQPDSGLLALFSHALLARYFVVTALLCTVMAICFYTINLATDSLQVGLLAAAP